MNHNFEILNNDIENVNKIMKDSLARGTCLSWERIKDFCEKSKSSNNEYRTALKIIGEFCADFHSSFEKCINFRDWLLQRIKETN